MKKQQVMNRSQLYQALQGKAGVALVTLYDKAGAAERVKRLIDLNWGIIGSRGTVQELAKTGIEAYDVAILKGRGPSSGHLVVTISDEVANALLSCTDEALRDLRRRRIPKIDLVWVGLYPLEEEAVRSQCTSESVWKNTDIGGRVLLMEAAKGQRLTASSPEQMDSILDWLEEGQRNEVKFRKNLAWQADARVAEYSAVSATYHSDGVFKGIFGRQVKELRYGENPYQKPAYLFATDFEDPLAIHQFQTAGGKEAGWINETDLDRSLAYMTRIAAVYEQHIGYVPNIALAVKHGNACGAAVGKNAKTVLEKMLAGDLRAVFGGMVMTNFEVEKDCAEVLRTYLMVPDQKRVLDVVIAPSFTWEAVRTLARAEDRCRMATNEALFSLGMKDLDKEPMTRFVRGGFLVQPNYNEFMLNLRQPEITLARGFTSSEAARGAEQDVILAWAIGSLSDSNTITLVRDRMLIGNGVGQQDRVGGCELAVLRANWAKHSIEGATAFSDSFFPFPDGPKVLIEAGVKAILAMSGSVRDKETIELCQECGVALYLVPNEVGRGFAWH